LLSRKVSKKFEGDVELETENQLHEPKMNYCWTRIFSSADHTMTKNADWRITLYILQNGVEADFMLFNPGKNDYELFRKYLEEYYQAIQENEDNNRELRRSYLQIGNYGKRRDVQQGRDHMYGTLKLCLGSHGGVYEEPDIDTVQQQIEELEDMISPKQLAIRYKIANPMGSYWNEGKEDNSINKRDADILRDPEETVDRITSFLERSFHARERMLEDVHTDY